MELKKYKVRKTGEAFWYLKHKSIEIKFTHLGQVNLHPNNKFSSAHDTCLLEIRRSDGKILKHYLFNSKPWEELVKDGLRSYAWLSRDHPEFKDLLEKDLTLKR